MVISFLQIMIQNAFEQLSTLIENHAKYGPDESKLHDNQLNVQLEDPRAESEFQKPLLSLQLILRPESIETNPFRLDSYWILELSFGYLFLQLFTT